MSRERPQLHVTAVDMFARCGEQFRRRYILGEIRPPAVAPVVGSGVHRAASATFGRKLEGQELLGADAMADIAADYVAREFSGEVDLGPEPVSKRVAAGEAVDMAARLARAHAEHIAPAHDPVSVERPFSIRLDDFLAERGIAGELDLVGTIDLETRAPDAAPAIRDLKTTRKAPDAAAAESSTQLALYSIAKRVLDGEHASSLALDYLVDAKGGVRHAPIASPPVSAQRQAAALNRVAVVARAIETGLFAPVEPGHWACSRKWCGYYDTCVYAANPKSVLIQLAPPDSSPQSPKEKHDES